MGPSRKLGAGQGEIRAARVEACISTPGRGRQIRDRVGSDQDDLFQARGSPHSAAWGRGADGNEKLKVASNYTRSGSQTWSTSDQGMKQEDGDFARARTPEDSGPSAQVAGPVSAPYLGKESWEG